MNPSVGVCVEDLDTPALLVDLDVMERNLARVADYSARHGLRLRPHTKTHKSTVLARRQLSLGAAGLTVAKTGEAEIMAETGTGDLLVAFPVIGETKLRRLAGVAKKTRVTVALDSVDAARALSHAAQAFGVTFGLLVEMDVGLGRVGVPPEEAVELARACSTLTGIEVRGLTFYPGHIREQNEEQIRTLSSTVAGARHALARAGIATEIVSGGSTPLLFRSHEVEGVNEIRPGTYIFNDMNTVRSGACALEDCAASILVTVVSHARRERMIVDGGSKTFSSDVAVGVPGFGRLTDAPGALFGRMNEEHGFIDLTGAERGFVIGQKTRIIPNHICVAVNLHEQIYGVRRGMVEEVWRPEARGKLQ
jgi:D-serine deaminase-like pyridoxal phosphate-dependent protein